MTDSKLRSVVRGVGACLPKRVLSNAELAERVDTSDEWIEQRTGIRQRHIAAEGQTTSHLGTRAAEAALVDAGLTRRRHRSHHRRDLDPRLHVSRRRDPDAGQSRMHHGVAFDLQAVCSGFVFAVATADKFLISGSHRRALVIGAETFSRLLDWTDRTTCVLFGDGAGAIVLEAADSDGEADLARSHLDASCARTAATAPSSMSTAAPRRPRPSAICAWRAGKSSSTRSAW